VRLAEHIWDTLHKIRCAAWMDFAYKNVSDNLVLMYEQELLNFVYDLQEEIDAQTSVNIVDVSLDFEESSHTLLRFTVLLPKSDMTEEEIDLYPDIENADTKVERVIVDALPSFFGPPDIEIVRDAKNEDPRVENENEQLSNAFAESLLVEYEKIEDDE
jgi:hypothetical protein